MRRRLLVTACVAVLAVTSLIAASQLALIVRVESPSMSPTIDVGNIVVATRDHGDAIERGAIYIFTDPGDWAASVARHTGRESVTSIFVKRIIGLPGERVACCTTDGRITIDGVPLDEDYLPRGTSLASILAFDATVPDDAVFMLGDARESSIDSRYLGSVPIEVLVARERWVLPTP